MTQEHLHTVAAWLMPHMTMANVSAFRPRLLQRRMLSQAGTVVKLGDKAFDKQWIILGDEASTRALAVVHVRSQAAHLSSEPAPHSHAGFV